MTPQVKLGEVVVHRKEFVRIDDLAMYRRCRVQLHTKGIVLRDIVEGAAIKTKWQQVCRAGEFLVAEIDAKVGGFGIVPDDLDGAIVSSHYFLFAVDEARLDRGFLGHFIRTPAFSEQVGARGSTNYAAIRPSHVLEYEIPLPPLEEQRRIVAKIDQLAAKIDEARGLRNRADSTTPQVLSSGIGRVFAEVSNLCAPRRLSDFSPHVTSGPRSWAKHYAAEGHRFYRAQDVGPNGEILEDSKIFIDPPPGKQGRTAILAPGDLMIVITGATVGRCTLFTEHHEPGFVSQHVAICRLPKQDVHAAYVLWGLLGPDGQRQLLGSRYGQGKPGLNLTNIRSLKLPFPSLDEQRGIVVYLDNLKKKVQTLKVLQEKSATELDALMPTILDKAFRGDL